MTLKPVVVGLSVCAVAALTIRGSAAPHRAHLSQDLLRHQELRTPARARVIVHGDSAAIDGLATRHHLQIVRRMAHGAVVVANSTELEQLGADAAVDHLSGDQPVKNWMSVSKLATGTDQVMAGTSGLFGIGSIPGVTGAGIGVAVVDSGISPHSALAKKVVANVSFVSGDPAVTDVYGHGTHVAGIIAGTAGAASTVTPLYNGGIAPGAQIVNVRVLGADGSGQTSDVIAGIEWVIANRTTYNIRVMNLSLGHPVTEPSATDPLCEAVANAVEAGIVVVAAAGNSGRSADGHMVLGSIASPGNSPYALTVGALNTWGTIDRRDDSVTTYSSRGPTRYENIVKPDLAAPGNKIVSLQANGSYLPTIYPTLHKAGSGNNAYMLLSGTSMAAPMVSGAVALLLQGNPGLTVAQVRIALQSGATYVKNGGLMGAGAGSANFWASRRTTSYGLLGSLLTTTLGGLSVTSSGASFTDLHGQLVGRLYGGLGIRLLSILQAPLAWLNTALLHDGDLNLLGLNNPLASVAPKWLLYGQVAGWTSGQSIMWGDTIYDPDGQSIMWGDANTSDDYSIMWGDSVSPDAQ